MLQIEQILTQGRYYKQKFGTKVYKIPISVYGFTCPNIDGTVAKGGCSFCENESFSPNLQDKSKLKLNSNSKTNPYLARQIKELEEQFLKQKNILSKKFGAKKFIVYFQSFSNTYAPFETLKVLYEKALSFDDVLGLNIGTRTDCMSDEILDYLSNLAKTKEICLEYGIQSFYDETLIAINRGHDSANMLTWIKKTKEKNINICLHIIFGLPKETQEMMLKTCKISYDLGVQSVKFHPLYVVKHTLLTNKYKKGEFTPISEEQYIDTLVKALKMMPKNIVVQRISAGIDSTNLLAPMWCKCKHEQMKTLRLALLKEGLNY